MIIRCPQCGHTRTVNPSKIPASAELATCPRCKNRFRFRTLPKDLTRRTDPAPVGRQNLAPAKPAAAAEQRGSSSPGGKRGQAPSREQTAASSSQKNLIPPPNSPDIWDAVDSLHRQWQEDMERQGHILPPEAVPQKNSAPENTEPAPQAASPGPQKMGQSAPVAGKPFRHAGVYANPWAEREAARNGSEDETSAHEPRPDTPPSPHFQTAGPLASPEEDESGDDLAAPQILTEPDSPSGPEPPVEAETPAPFLGDAMEAEQTPVFEAEHAPVPDAHGADDDAALPQEAPDDATGPESEEAHTSQAGQGVFPFAFDDMPAEERVDRDMRYMNGQEDQPERTLRDLGRLDDHWGTDQEKNGDTAVTGEIPWENPGAHGWVRSFMATVRGAMFDAPSFFARFTSHGSPASGYLFFLLLGCLAVVGSLIWVGAAARLLPSAVRMESLEGMPVLLILAPLILGLVQLFIAGGIRLMLLITAPDKADFTLIFKIVSYAAAPMLLSVVPFVGPAVGGIWFLVTLVLGCRHALGLSWQQAVAAPLPPALLLLGGAFWYFLY